MSTQEPEEHPFHILRGKRIEEFSAPELIALHKQIEDQLPDLIDHLDSHNVPHLLELELIEDELERRHERYN